MKRWAAPLPMRLRASMRRMLPDILGLGMLEFAWLMALPLSLFLLHSELSPLYPLLGGVIFECVRLLLQQRLRRALRTENMSEVAENAVRKRQGIPEAETDSAFWSAHILEYAVSIDAPAIFATILAIAAILALSLTRLPGDMVLLFMSILGSGLLLGLVSNRLRTGDVAELVKRRQHAATWMAAAVRDTGELRAQSSLTQYLDRLRRVTLAWSETEDRLERRRFRHRLLIAFGALAALGAGLHLRGISIREIANAELWSVQRLADWMFLGLSLPIARKLGSHLDSFLIARGELLELWPEVSKAEPLGTLSLPHPPRRLSLRGVEVWYGRQLGLRIPELEISLEGPLGVVGPNGSGKTTLALLAAGVLTPSRGSVELDGRPVVRCDREAIGFVPQDPVLIETLSVEANVRLVAPHATDLEIRTELEQLGLGAALGRPAGELSRGERRRIAIARALLKRPRWLVLDEVDAGLDSEGRERLLACLGRLGAMRLLLVSHRRDFLGFAEHILTLSSEHQIAAVDQRPAANPFGTPPKAHAWGFHEEISSDSVGTSSAWGNGNSCKTSNR